MPGPVTLTPIPAPIAWRGDEIADKGDWVYQLNPAEIEELEEAGKRFLEDDPDLRSVRAESYPLPLCSAGLRTWCAEMDRGRGFILVRGLKTHHYSDALSAAIFFILGLHIGQPMRQSELGDMIQHIIATSDLPYEDPRAKSSRVRDGLTYHSDSSDVVSLLCLRPAKTGGASSLVSSATLYNEVLRRRPDLAPLLFEPWHNDWRKQDPDAPANTYETPMVSYVDGVFSAYIGAKMILSAQRYPEVPRLTEAQHELLVMIDEICEEPGIALHMDFRPGDMQWLLNYAALHNRTEFADYPEPQRQRHLLRLWLKRDAPRPLVANFGRHVVKSANEARGEEVPLDQQRFTIALAAVPRMDWGNA